MKDVGIKYANGFSVLYEHYSLVPKKVWVWKSFTPVEIASKGDGSILINFDSLDKLQALRDKLGKPLIINSAYRDPAHNARIGGSPMSMHKFGKAFDISLSNQDRAELIKVAEAVGFKGIGIEYKTFVHVDTGRYRRW